MIREGFLFRVVHSVIEKINKSNKRLPSESNSTLKSRLTRYIIVVSMYYNLLPGIVYIKFIKIVSSPDVEMCTNCSYAVYAKITFIGYNVLFLIVFYMHTYISST